METRALSTLHRGEFASIEQIQLTQNKIIKLLGLGIAHGVEVGVLRNRGGDMVLALGNARVSVGRTLSRMIEVSIL